MAEVSEETGAHESSVCVGTRPGLRERPRKKAGKGDMNLGHVRRVHPRLQNVREPRWERHRPKPAGGRF